MSKTVYMTVGFLGSGKSTWAKQFVSTHKSAKIVSADMFRQMLNGQYEYHAELDDVITESMFDTAQHLLNHGYDVIIDCGNLTEDPDRRPKWRSLRNAKRFVAVVMPHKDIDWHVANRLKNPHWEGVDWNAIAQGERDAFEPINESDYDEVVQVEKF